MGQVKFLGSIFLIALFTIAVIGFVINFGVDNNSAVRLEDNPTMNSLSVDIKQDLDITTNDVNSSSVGFFGGTQIEGASDNTLTGGSFKLGISNMVRALGSIKRAIQQELFGGDAGLGYFLTALFSFLTIVGIVYIWKTWKGGNPD